MTVPATPTQPEFSFPVDLEDLAPSGARLAIEADADQRGRVAARLGATGVEVLSGEFVLEPTATGLSVNARLRARFQRQCVASLEAMVEKIDQPFTFAFTREAASEPDEAGGATSETPERLESAWLDLGELLVQELALAMNPYPRKAGAAALHEAYGEQEGPSPFAALAKRNIAEPGRRE